MSSGSEKLSPFGKPLDENIFFVTRVWRRFGVMVSDCAAQTYSLDENRRCFRSGGQTGYGSELAHWAWSAVPMVELSSISSAYREAEIISSLSQHCDSLGRGLPLSFAGICALSLRYDVLFSAHQNTICLSVPNAKFALPMDMTTLISKVTSPAFPIDMTIIIWIILGLILGYFGTLSV